MKNVEDFDRACLDLTIDQSEEAELKDFMDPFWSNLTDE